MNNRHFWNYFWNHNIFKYKLLLHPIKSRWDSASVTDLSVTAVILCYSDRPGCASAAAPTGWLNFKWVLTTITALAQSAAIALRHHNHISSSFLLYALYFIPIRRRPFTVPCFTMIRRLSFCVARTVESLPAWHVPNKRFEASTQFLIDQNR